MVRGRTMLRQTWYWEVEVVRIQDGEQAAPARRLDFSVRPLNYLLGGLVAGGSAAALLLALVFYGPGDEFSGTLGDYCVWGHADPYLYDHSHYHGCGVVTIKSEPEVRPSRVPDSTFLVRRLP